MEPSKLLENFKAAVKSGCPEKDPKRPFNYLYFNDSLPYISDPLFNPPLAEESSPKRSKKENLFGLKIAELSLDMDFVKKVSKDTRFYITPGQGGQNYIKESIHLFESCLHCLPKFNTLDRTTDDTKSYFDNLVDSFFHYLDNEFIEVKLEPNETDELSPSDIKNLTKVEFSDDDIRSVMKQMFLATVLAYNWSLKLFKYTEFSFDIAKCDLKDFDHDNILKTAMGIREANRNYIFYNHVCEQLWDILKSKDRFTNSFISEFLERISFVNNIANADLIYHPTYWKRLKTQLADEEGPLAPFPITTEHEENLNLIRYEMSRRLSARSAVEYYRKELEDIDTEYEEMEINNNEVFSSLDLLRKQMNTLVESYEVKTPLSLKMDEFKKLPLRLYRLFLHLNNFTISNPLREVTFKLLKDSNPSLSVMILAPRDLLFPSLEATKFVFPLVLHFYMDGDEVKVKQVGNPKLSTSKKVVDLVLNRFLGVDQDQELDLGIKQFKDQLPQDFNQHMEKLYKLAQEFVWNLYVLESYKSNNKSILSKILPSELQKRNTLSKYTYKEKNTWNLSNDSASVTVKVLNSDDKFQFDFSDFEKTGSLETPEASDLVEHVKKTHELKVENLTELAPVIFEHFHSGNDLIHLALLFESYAVLFDFTST